MNESKVIRKCIACNSLKPRNELIKITKHFRTKEIVVDPSSDITGRSCYICRDFSCIETAFKKGRLCYKYINSRIWRYIFNGRYNQSL